MRIPSVMVVVGLCVSACGGGESAGGSAMADTATPPEVTFTATEFAFLGPEMVPAGPVTLVLDNAGMQLHHLQLLRLQEGRTFEELEAALAVMKPGDPPLAWAVSAGGVNPPDPGARTRATLVLEPGDYAIVCFVDIPDRVPHVMKGMVKALTVTPAEASPAPLPTEDVTLTLVDYAFGFSTPLTAGKHVIKIVNGASQPHEFELVRLAPGKTIDDLMAWAETYEGPLPGSSLGGAPAMAPGQVEYVPMELAPGDYVALCFVPDANDGMPHAMHGMITPFTVS